MEEIYIKQHRDLLKKTDNIFIKKYFGEFNFFHDSYVKKWKYEPRKSKLTYKVLCENYFSKNKKQIEFDLIFNDIFEIKFMNQFSVDKEFYKDIEWKSFFSQRKDFCFLYCFFRESKYINVVGEYMKLPIYQAHLFFDNYFNVELDFCGLKINEPKETKKLSYLQLYELIRNSNYNN